jgi:polyphosphate kinase 2 (PPK2 family)
LDVGEKKRIGVSKKIMQVEVYGRRSRGRQKKRWEDVIQQDLKLLKLKKEDTGNRDKWSRRIRVADPSPE